MSDAQDEATTRSSGRNVRELVIPLTMLGGLLLLTWQGGIRFGQMSAEIAAQSRVLEKIEESVNPVDRARLDAKTEGELSRLRDDLARTNQELRLLKDFTEGRIGSLPYRSSK